MNFPSLYPRKIFWIADNFTLLRLAFSTVALRPLRSAGVSKTTRSNVPNQDAPFWQRL
jgi:hypothetical protein